MTGARCGLLTLVALLALGIAGAGLWRAAGERPAALEERTESIAAELRCPTCQAQSVAMSRSEIATAMRAEISAQLSAGRTPSQVRDWFAARYGPDVLLDPPAAGMGLLLWLVPAGLLGGGLAVTAAVVRRRRIAAVPAAVPAPETAPAPDATAGTWVRLAVPAALAVVVAGTGLWAAARPAGPAEPGVLNATPVSDVGRYEHGVADRPMDPDAWLALGAALESEGAYSRSAEAYQTATVLRPEDLRTRVRLGLVLLKAGKPAEAGAVAEAILSGDAAQPEGLLVLGLAQRAQGLPAAPDTLRRLLDIAPTHPAADQVRRLLATP